jgi:hypothetical protein
LQRLTPHLAHTLRPVQTTSALRLMAAGQEVSRLCSSCADLDTGLK